MAPNLLEKTVGFHRVSKMMDCAIWDILSKKCMQGLRADALNQNWSNKILMAWQRDKSEKYPEQYSWLEDEAKASN